MIEKSEIQKDWEEVLRLEKLAIAAAWKTKEEWYEASRIHNVAWENYWCKWHENPKMYSSQEAYQAIFPTP